MKAVILSGGAGTRLRAVSGDLPKPMMPLLGKPLLEHTVALLRENGFDRLCLTLHYQPQRIRDHFGDGARFGVRIEYRDETAPLGTAGAVPISSATTTFSSSAGTGHATMTWES